MMITGHPLPSVWQVHILIMLPTAGWAIYKKQHVTWVLVLYLCQTLWAAGMTGRTVAKYVSD